MHEILLKIINQIPTQFRVAVHNGKDHFNANRKLANNVLFLGFEFFTIFNSHLEPSYNTD